MSMKTRRAVKRPFAETYILISLTAFALTVVVTRVFLELAGYPQVGNSVLHIAHAIWGGLLAWVFLSTRWGNLLLRRTITSFHQRLPSFIRCFC